MMAKDQERGPRHFLVLVEGAIPIDRTQADRYVSGEDYPYWPLLAELT
jgi:hypothetical protein